MGVGSTRGRVLRFKWGARTSSLKDRATSNYYNGRRYPLKRSHEKDDTRVQQQQQRWKHNADSKTERYGRLVSQGRGGSDHVHQLSK